ncbi:MAG: hypothetical protein HFH23_17240 [Ruminococcus sp.]|nr:hypothetical protein [Ruminococcus sp.]
MRERLQKIMGKTTERAAKKADNQKRMDALLKMVKDLMKTMGWTAEQCMEALGVSEEEKAKLASRL